MPLSLAAHPMIRKIETLFLLTPEERDAVVALPFALRNYNADQDIVRDRDRPSQCCIIVKGLACRYKIMGEGKRQIMSFHIPGDMPDVMSLHLEVMDHSLATMTPSVLAFLPHEVLRPFLAKYPRISDALWRDTLVDGAIFREWVCNVGHREAYPRIAHLLCEMFVRMRVMELAGDDGFDFAATQQEIGDATGLSTVHVNRTLQKLRGDGLIRSESGRVVILNWADLQRAGEFDDTFLHLRPGVVTH